MSEKEESFIKAFEKIANLKPAAPLEVEPVKYTTQVERGLEGISSSRHSGEFCLHSKKKLDDELRFVVCEECGGCLDPYDVLMRLVRDNENVWWRAKHNEDEIKHLSEKVKSLKKELKSLDGKVKRRKENLR